MLKIIELFSGIGAQVAALKRLGIDYEVVGISEIDKYAIKSYEAINGATYNYGDITKIESLDYADLWTYSFPCQDLSVAGKQAGIKEDTRSGLLLHVERLLNKSVDEMKQPKYLLLENVKALVGKKFKPDFDRWLDKLEQLGYNNYWQVLNAKDYGIPQNRERVFVVSIRKDVDTEGYVFPSPLKLEKRLKDILEPYVAEKYYLSDEKVGKFAENLKDKEISNTIRCGGGGSLDGKHTWDIVAEPLCVASRGRNPDNPSDRTAGSPTEQRLEINYSGCTNTLTTVQKDNLVIIQKPHGFNKGGVHENAPTITSNGSYQENNFVVEPKKTNRFFNQAFETFYNNKCEEGDTIDAFNKKINKTGCSPTLTTRPEGFKTAVLTVVQQVASLTDKNHQQDRVYSADGLCPTLPTMTTGGNLQPKVIENGYRIRKLTPKECWRLMGFTDVEFECAMFSGVSNSQLYKQAGNSIVVNVLEAIFKELLNARS